jgi:hypothetical protein
MDIWCLLQDPELAFSNRDSCWGSRLSPDFAQGSKRVSAFHSRAESIPARIVSVGWFPSGHRGVCQSTERGGGNQISGSQSFHVFSHRDHFILQSPAQGGRLCRFYHLGSECALWSFRHRGLFDRRTSAPRIHIADCRGLVYGRFTADRTRNTGRISGRGLRRG